ncbi:hypothetical protein [Armatimonas rosea]|uniref:C2 domain-containing protein n=1 Tax=Armatimonas rosea TaxID=685828 RepID=A0A7W9W945_ARMRO|nr:hypothetical protein [Armatimonas rosea]MBB6052815.1 hypothetical protein [Armatimonas rosea]
MSLFTHPRALWGSLVALSLLACPAARADINVVVDIDQIKCIDENDSLTKDEPYLIAVPFFIDGSTVKVGALSGNAGFAALPSSTVTVLKANKTQKNIKNEDDWCKEGSTWYSIPASTGQFKHTMKPISPDVIGPFSKKVALAGVIVAVVEEDGSTVQAANASRDAIVSTLKDQLTLAMFQQKFDIDAIRQKVTTQVKNAAISATVQNLTLAGIVDPDDLMGADADTWTYEQLEQAGAGGIPINMHFKNKDDGEYAIRGKVRIVQEVLPSQVTVKVTKVSAVGDFGESPDFYAKLSIAGNEKRTGTVEDKSMIEPNWTHTVTVGQDEEVPIVITLMESDTLKDDVVDINPNKSSGPVSVPLSNLPLVYNRVSGEIFHRDPISGERKKIGTKGQTITMKGKGSGETAEIRFTIQ